MSTQFMPQIGLTGLAIATGLSGPMAYAAPPEAGEVIENTGSVSYLNTALGLVETVSSNTVSARINAVPDFSITSDQTYVRSPGERALFSFQVTNTGNVDTDVVLDLNSLPGDYNFAFTNAYIDSNNNGRIDTEDTPLTPGVAVALAFAGQLSVLVDVGVPETAGDGETARAKVSASLMNGGPVRAATGEVVIDLQAISLSKSASVGQSSPGSEIVYSLQLRNNSATPIDPDTLYAGLGITVDGVSDSRFLVQDSIPLNTSYERVVAASNFDIVYHRRGDAADIWTATELAPEDMDSIGFVSDEILPPGESRDFSFAVTVNSATNDVAIENAAEVLLPGSTGGFDARPSNLVITPIEGTPGTIEFYRTDTFTSPSDDAGFNDNVFLELVSGQCNLTQGIDRAMLTVETSPEGDRERVEAIETAPNSGIFRTQALPTIQSASALPGDGILQGSRRSVVSAKADCDPNVGDEIVMAPAGAVFVSTTNEPVSGAKVELLDEAGNVLATQITDIEGLFEIQPSLAGQSAESSNVKAATGQVVQIRVTPPTEFTSPSLRTNFPGYGRFVDPSASYSKPFSFDPALRAIMVDIPVDPDMTGALTIAKAANRQRVQVGDVVQYTIDVRNSSPIAIEVGEIEDTLPPGLSYVEGSARYNNTVLSDPLRNTRGDLVFPLGLIGPKSQNTLVYSVSVNASASEGDAVNRAVLNGNLIGLPAPVRSNVASASVKIDNSQSVFSRKGVILGKVFLDCDGDGVQRNGADGEPGIPGVLIHTEEGLSVVTDGAGRFSLAGLSPVTHVLDVYEPTLPNGSKLVVNRTMDAGSAGSRFVPLRAGEVRSEDFAVHAPGTNGCSWPVYNDVRMRIEGFENHALGQPASIGTLQLDKTRGAAFSSEYESSVETAIYADTAQGQQAAGLTAPIMVPASSDLEELLAKAPKELAFADLSDQDQLLQRVVSIRITGPAALKLSLTRNGSKISSGRIGTVQTAGDRQIVEYVAVKLKPGANTLSLRGEDDFGNVRAEKIITVTAPGAPARLNIIAPQTALADPAHPVPIILQIVDANGHPTAAPLEATLLEGEDKFDLADMSEQQPGLQTRIANGQAQIDLIPSATVGTRLIRIESAFGSAQARIRFTPNVTSKPIAVGYAEAVFNLKTGGLDALPGQLAKDELSLFEDTEEGIEGAIYLKGRVPGDTLLTLRYDSDRDLENSLFRSVEPDRFYPVYGDQSERGFDALSRGKIFAKAERGASYILFGDVAYEASSNAIQLGRFQRTLEGAQAHAELGPARLNLYAGETDTGQTVLEIPARGVSGPYDLGFGEVVQNSETVELITRDRNQPGVILKTETLGRFSAYTLDYFARTLVFTRPIPSRDEDLNPVSFRVTFETEERRGESYAVFGGEAAFDLNDWLTIGARSLTANAPSRDTDKRSVQSAFIEADIGARGSLQVEAATTRNNLGEEGQAARLSYEQQTETGSYGARLASTSDDFDAPGASISKGRQEARLYGNTRFRDGANVTAEAIYSSAEGTDEKRYGLVSRYERSVADTLRLRAGGRYVVQDNASGLSDDALTVIAGLNWAPDTVKGLSLDLEAEQEVTDGSASRLAIGADYALTPKWRTYLQGEYTGSRSGEFGLADAFNNDVTLRAGTEYRWMDNLTAFTELRSNQGLFDSGVAQGLNVNWKLSDALNVRARAEYVQPIIGQFQRNAATGIGFSWQPEDGLQILDGDVEYNAREGGQQSWYASSAYGRRWQDVTLLARNRFATITGNGEKRIRDRMRLGWAHRPASDDALNTLTWYEFELDDQTDQRETRHIWSIGGERKPSGLIRYRGRLAGQYYSYTGQGLDIDNVALLAQGGIERDVGKSWNVAANLMSITDGRFEDQTWGIGGEINYVAAENTMIGIGYNHTDLNGAEFKRLYRSGVFIRLRIKADQDLWNIFGSTD